MRLHCKVCGIPITPDPTQVDDVYDLALWYYGEAYCPPHYDSVTRRRNQDDDQD